MAGEAEVIANVAYVARYAQVTAMNDNHLLLTQTKNVLYSDYE